MKQQLTIVVAALAVATFVGAVVGFIRRRLERMDAADAEAGIVGFDSTGAEAARERAASVNGNPR